MTRMKATPEQLDAMEREHLGMAREEVEARKRAGLEVTSEWLEALERKYMAIAVASLGEDWEERKP
jgi:hypothetical protein